MLYPSTEFIFLILLWVFFYLPHILHRHVANTTKPTFSYLNCVTAVQQNYAFVVSLLKSWPANNSSRGILYRFRKITKATDNRQAKFKKNLWNIIYLFFSNSISRKYVPIPWIKRELQNEFYVAKPMHIPFYKNQVVYDQILRILNSYNWFLSRTKKSW